MSLYELKREDITPLLEGLTVYGTGGGGEPEWGRVILENEFAQGRTCQIIDPEDIPDDALVCSGGIMGSVKALEGIAYETICAQWEEDFPLIHAVREMERLQGRKVDYMVPFEVGGLNTPVIMSVCARLGIPMINGDGNGRSAPETQMTAFIGNGVELYPMPLVDCQGNTVIVTKANEPTYADEIGRFIVVKAGGMGANTHYPMTGEQAKKACVPHTVTSALELGRKIGACAAKGESAVEAVAGHFAGQILFSGEITEIKDIDKGGFYLTDCTLNGIGQWSGHEARMINKNETMILWVDGQQKIMFPDRLFMLDPDTGKAVTSVNMKTGVRLTLVACPCHPRIASFVNTPIGQASMGAARYGFSELPYVAYRP